LKGFIINFIVFAVIILIVCFLITYRIEKESEEHRKFIYEVRRNLDWKLSSKDKILVKDVSDITLSPEGTIKWMEVGKLK